MPQKPLKVAKKIQKPTGNRHGKQPKMKIGKRYRCLGSARVAVAWLVLATLSACDSKAV
jgi:hypothetical protein